MNLFATKPLDLLMKEAEGFVVEFELSLDARVNQFDATALRGGW